LTSLAYSHRLLLDDFSSLDDFSTVNDFLRQTAIAKQGKRLAISASISDHLEDPGTVGLPPAIVKIVENLVEDYGDEAYRQLALFSLGKWFEHHIRAIDQLFQEDHIEGGCSALMDATRISDALHLLCELGSFSGDDKWKTMLNEEISQTILEAIEEELS